MNKNKIGSFGPEAMRIPCTSPHIRVFDKPARGMAAPRRKNKIFYSDSVIRPGWF